MYNERRTCTIFVSSSNLPDGALKRINSEYLTLEFKEKLDRIVLIFEDFPDEFRKELTDFCKELYEYVNAAFGLYLSTDVIESIKVVEVEVHHKIHFRG